MPMQSRTETSARSTKAGEETVTNHRPMFRPLLVGVEIRLLVVAAILVFLWAGFHWATSAPGGA